MHNASAALINYLAANNVAFRADLFTLTTIDGTILRRTTFLQSLTVGGNTFTPMGAPGSNEPLIKRGPLTQAARLTIDTLDVTLVGPSYLNGTLISSLAQQGYFDGGRFRVEPLIMPTPGDVSLGSYIAFDGGIAGIQPAGFNIQLKIKSDLEDCNQTLPKIILGPSCSNVVYDPNCTLSKAAQTISGTVSSVTDSTHFATATAAITAKATGWFNLGVVAFTSGALNGMRIGVTAFTTGTGAITLALPMSPLPAPGDTFNIYPGCDRTRAKCAGFSNLPNFRGYVHVPLPEGGSF